VVSLGRGTLGYWTVSDPTLIAVSRGVIRARRR
jgi:hypothetical protein